MEMKRDWPAILYASFWVICLIMLIMQFLLDSYHDSKRFEKCLELATNQEMIEDCK